MSFEFLLVNTQTSKIMFLCADVLNIVIGYCSNILQMVELISWHLDTPFIEWYVVENNNILHKKRKLKQDYEKYADMLTKTILDLLVFNFNEKFNFGDEFWICLDNNHGMISGSWVIKQLLGDEMHIVENFDKPHDVDIYVPSEFEQGMSLFFQQREYNVQIFTQDHNIDYIRLPSIKSISKCQKDSIFFDVIAYKQESPTIRNLINQDKTQKSKKRKHEEHTDFDYFEMTKQHIESNFDFEFLMNGFTRDQIWIHSIYSIVARTSDRFNSSNRSNNTCIYGEHINAEFWSTTFRSQVNEIVNQRPYYIIDRITEDHHLRCLKYIERGFTISNYNPHGALYVVPTKSSYVFAFESNQYYQILSIIKRLKSKYLWNYVLVPVYDPVLNQYL